MKHQVKSIFAHFLILCITVSIIPLNLFHHHESTEILCAKTDPSADIGSRHNAILLSDGFTEIPCDHETHIDRKQDHCEFCELLTTRHYNYLVSEILWLSPLHEQGEELFFETTFTPDSSCSEIFNKGPPATVRVISAHYTIS